MFKEQHYFTRKREGVESRLAEVLINYDESDFAHFGFFAPVTFDIEGSVDRQGRNKFDGCLLLHYSYGSTVRIYYDSVPRDFRVVEVVIVGREDNINGAAEYHLWKMLGMDLIRKK